MPNRKTTVENVYRLPVSTIDQSTWWNIYNIPIEQFDKLVIWEQDLSKQKAIRRTHTTMSPSVMQELAYGHSR
jgi:hypothetical protein